MDEARMAEAVRLVAMFGEHLEREGYSSCTIRGYRIHLNFFLDFLRGQDADGLAALTPDHVHRYQVHLHGRVFRGRPVALETHYSRLVALQSFYRFLIKRGHVLADPTSGLELPRRKRALPRGVMTTAEVRRMLAQPDADTPLGLRDKTIFELLYSAGLRNSELRHLAINDVDTAQGEVTVRRGKGGKDRVVPMGEIAARCVEEYLRAGRPWFLSSPWAPAGGVSDLLFIGRHGGGLSATGLARLVRRHLRRARIAKPVTPHSFRHTCATHMLKGRANLRYVQELLGHGSIATTQVYTHVEVGDLKREHQRCHPREQVV